MLEGALFCPEGGYVNDPALSAHNIMRAAEAKGAEFMFNAEVVKIRAAEGKVQGITLADGTEIDAPVVVNCRRPPLLQNQPDGPGRLGRLQHQNQSPAPRGHVLPLA
jgi:glycine/D-amino acid oxidase-like deaminating enzyme